MDRSTFIKTLIEVLKYNSKYKSIESRDQLLRLLGRARVNFVPQYGFANHGRSYQHWEIVELRVPVPLLEVAEENEKILEELVKYVYEESDDYALHHVEIRPQVVDTPDEVTEHNVVFDAIQEKVIQGIKDAKFIIWAAVAWFSNEAIYQELLAKKKQGLNIRIIVSQEDSNTNMISKLEENNFDVVVIPRWGNGGYNRMHDKFCIIDMDYVMHGSYNWTPTANKNVETLATALDHELVAKFAKEFMELYNGIYF
ncbi:phospholipase D-like domain-containing protein [Peptostreptococcus stomatis]|uniref:phospholipase D-like domain-containing protein n=1 Tax=Peptostreptococcus stomatis TaxID=341694 RepID=UPI0039930C53